jgi:hypothetical protein
VNTVNGLYTSCLTPRRRLTRHPAGDRAPDLRSARLPRINRESLHQLLDRLGQALGPAVDDQIFVDEINGSNRLPRGGFARL